MYRFCSLFCIELISLVVAFVRLFAIHYFVCCPFIPVDWSHLSKSLTRHSSLNTETKVLA